MHGLLSCIAEPARWHRRGRIIISASSKAAHQQYDLELNMKNINLISPCLSGGFSSSPHSSPLRPRGEMTRAISSRVAMSNGVAGSNKPQQPAFNWFAEDPSKAWAERYYLVSTFLTLVAFLGGVIGSGLYVHCGKNAYLAISLAMATVTALPFFLSVMSKGAPDRSRPLTDRFWLKAFVWNAIFGFIGNYFWTHYFYSLLGARYTFDTYYLNQVPWPCFLATQAYFCFYHTATTIALRKVKQCFNYYLHRKSANEKVQKCLSNAGSLNLGEKALYYMIFWLVVAILSYVTALGEAVTIAHFPYYDFHDRDTMYKYGSIFYGLYFVVSFPMYLRIDEDVNEPRFTLSQTMLDSFAASMIVTLLLDFWKLAIGAIFDSSSTTVAAAGCPQATECALNADTFNCSPPFI